MKITLVGTGCGSMYTMTAGAIKAIRESKLTIGARRLVDGIPQEWGGRRKSAISPDEIVSIIDECQEDVCVLFSGDTGFYSGARQLLPLLEEREYDVEILPGISSVQMLSARTGRPWQDWKLVSAHGTDCDVAECMEDSNPVFFLTGGSIGPAQICARMADIGMGDSRVIIAERLSYEDEKIHYGRAEDHIDGEFDSLSVILVEPVERRQINNTRNFRAGLPDNLFIRGDVPMTKQDVRAVIAGHMQVREDDVIWDVGAGTGSVTVELAIQASRGWVYAVEMDYDGVRLIDQNVDRFGLHNVEAIGGQAPAALSNLPAPDRVFIGGSDGNMREIIEVILEKNPRALICASAILIETAAEAVSIMEEFGMQTDMVQVNISTSRMASGKHMMIGGNPIFIVTGSGS